jgi:non-heme chloroperoxidase
MNPKIKIQLMILGAGLALSAAATGESIVDESEGPFRFAELFPLRDQIAEMPPLEPYRTRDGSALSFRRYPAESNTHFILIHGSSAHGAYLHAFAKYLSEENVANVYAPDLRGHGPSPQRRGDIDYIGQLEDDLADLISHIRKGASKDARYIVGGHSSGGGLALRFAGGAHGYLAQGFVLLAPYLGHDAPMVKKNAGGWADASILKIIGISVLDGLGLKHFNDSHVLRFNLPEKYHNGYETLEYSFRLMKGMHPKNYKESLKTTRAPLLIIVGSEDEAFHAKDFEQGILPYKKDVRISFVEGGSHLGIIMSKAAMAEAAHWIESN